MKIGILGTGNVGQTITAKLVQLGHEVMIGTRDQTKLMARTERRMGSTQTFSEWYQQYPTVKIGDYAETSAFGQLVFNCVYGTGVLDALKLAGEKNLNGKILIDITNAVDLSKGMPPTLFVANTDSLGEQVQRALPNVKVVKTLNSIVAPLMVNPQALANGDHTMFVAGNDAAAKTQVIDILKNWFNWREVVDLGDITGARSMEVMLLLWARLANSLGTPMIGLKVVQ